MDRDLSAIPSPISVNTFTSSRSAGAAGKSASVRPEYRQDDTLSDGHKHWFRAKFFQQYRLLFRYHASGKVIVLAWVNDEDTKRASESSNDAYLVFRKILKSGHRPDNWNPLWAAA